MLSIFFSVSGWMLGDPHITTLDGYAYTFNGLGEYTLVTIPDTNGTADLFTLQGRTMRALDIETSQLTDATFFVAFAAQAANSTLVREWNYDNVGLILTEKYLSHNFLS